MLRHPFTNILPVSGTIINATAFIIYACVNLPPTRAKYTEYKSPICAMGVFRSQTPRACECSPLLPLHPSPAFSLTAIYRSVPRSRYTHRRKNYHRKFRCIPTFSRYSCLAFSLSSSVGAVLYFVYKSRLTIASNFSSKPFFISGKTSSISTK